MSTTLRTPTTSELLSLTRWRQSVFLVCLFGYVGYYICRKNISAAFPLMSSEFGYSNSELGLIAFYSELAYAGGKIINGPLADKFGGRKMFLIGMVGAIISNILFSQGSNLMYFIGVWCLCRYFLSMGWGGLIKMIGNWYEPEKNGRVMGFISLNFQFGGVVATLFAGFLISQGFGWKAVFLFPAGVLGVVFILSFLYSKEKPTDLIQNVKFGREEIKDKELKNNPRYPLKNISILLKSNSFRYVLVFSFFTTFLRSIFFFWTPKFLVDLGLGTSNAIMKSTLFPFLGCLGTVLLGWYTDKYAKNGDRAKAMWIMLTGLIVSLLSIVIGIQSGEMNSFIVIMLGACGFFLLGPYSMSSGALTLDIAGAEMAGSATGMIDSLGYIGGAIAVWSAGRLSDSLGWAEVFMLLSLCAILATFSAFLLSREFQKSGTHVSV